MEIETETEWIPYQVKYPRMGNQKFTEHKGVVQLKVASYYHLPDIVDHVRNSVFQALSHSAFGVKSPITDVQVEGILYAVGAFLRATENKRAPAFLLQDAMGMGKGRQIAGTFLYYIKNKMPGPHVWVSTGLHMAKPSFEDLVSVTQGEYEIVWIRKASQLNRADPSPDRKTKLPKIFFVESSAIRKGDKKYVIPNKFKRVNMVIFFTYTIVQRMIPKNKREAEEEKGGEKKKIKEDRKRELEGEEGKGKKKKKVQEEEEEEIPNTQGPPKISNREKLSLNFQRSWTLQNLAFEDSTPCFNSSTVITLDECHKAKNVGSSTGNYLFELQRALKSTPFLYVSATPFESFEDLEYLERIVGDLVDIGESKDPVDSVVKMTILGRYLRQEGRALARTLSLDQVTFDQWTIKISDYQAQQLRYITSYYHYGIRESKDSSKAWGRISQFFDPLAANWKSDEIMRRIQNEVIGGEEDVQRMNKTIIFIENTNESKEELEGISFIQVALQKTFPNLDVPLPKEIFPYQNTLDRLYQTVSERGEILKPMGEVTGRKSRTQLRLTRNWNLDPSISPLPYAPGNVVEDGKKVYKTTKDKVRDAFNQELIPVIILGKAAAEGISLHQTKKGGPKRWQIMQQPTKEAGTFLQSLGRANRYGQTIGPVIVMAMTDLAYEIYGVTRLMKKCAMIAGVTQGGTQGSSAASLFRAPDYLDVAGKSAVEHFIRWIFGENFDFFDPQRAVVISEEHIKGDESHVNLEQFKTFIPVFRYSEVFGNNEKVREIAKSAYTEVMNKPKLKHQDNLDKEQFLGRLEILPRAYGTLIRALFIEFHQYFSGKLGLTTELQKYPSITLIPGTKYWLNQGVWVSHQKVNNERVIWGSILLKSFPFNRDLAGIKARYYTFQDINGRTDAGLLLSEGAFKTVSSVMTKIMIKSLPPLREGVDRVYHIVKDQAWDAENTKVFREDVQQIVRNYFREGVIPEVFQSSKRDGYFRMTIPLKDRVAYIYSGERPLDFTYDLKGNVNNWPTSPKDWKKIPRAKEVIEINGSKLFEYGGSSSDFRVMNQGWVSLRGKVVYLR